MINSFLSNPDFTRLSGYLAPGDSFADAVGEIYLNTQKPYYSVGWIERGESQSF
ncbi:hypothetical protein [Nostoc sp. MG11]|uniref:hypothetical protein n=1 Tax=Nostoc sp. MG11 TaxID=2721166 RepID=UPI001866C31E|nr:hypothetical protein [Nostoc sp. MG11]